MRPMPAVIGSALLATSLATAQVATAPGGPQNDATPDTAKPLTFDVVSVKPDNGGMGSMMRMNPDGFTATNVPAHMLLTEAFQADEGQVIGEPD